MRRQLWLTFFLGFGIVVAIGAVFQSEVAVGIAFAAYAIAMLITGFKLILLPCPKCRCEFHLTTIAQWPTKCGNCGFSLYSDGKKFFW